MNLYYTTYISPVGKLHLLGGEKYLYAVSFDSSWSDYQKKLSRLFPDAQLINTKNLILKKIIGELKQYFSGERKKFTTPLQPLGTEFQKSAWSALQKIPFGKTISYQEQAVNIGSAKAVRAVGTANGQNPLPIVIPCHRVIGKNGKLAGYGGGLHIKEKLLMLEGAL